MDFALIENLLNMKHYKAGLKYGYGDVAKCGLHMSSGVL